MYYILFYSLICNITGQSGPDYFSFLQSAQPTVTNMSFYNFDNNNFLRFGGYNYYGVATLNRLEISGLYSPNAQDFFSFNSNTMQFNGYGDYAIDLGYHRNFSPRLTGGLQFTYRGIRSPENIGHDHPNLNLMVAFQMNPKVRVGLHLIQLIPRTVENGNYIPTHMRMEVQYFIQTYLIAWFRLSKQLDSSISPQLGLFYSREKMYFNLGIHPVNAALSYLLGYRATHHFSFQLGNQYHQQLGWSSQISIMYKW